MTVNGPVRRVSVDGSKAPAPRSQVGLRRREALQGLRALRRPRRGRLAALACFMGVICAAWMGIEGDFAGPVRPLSGPNALLYDAALGVAGRLSSAPSWPDVAVVLVDRATLDAPDWAGTPRALQQPQLGRLGRDLLDLGARKVGYDLVLAVDPTALAPPLTLPADYDEPLRALLRDHSDDVVLGGDVVLHPVPRYADAAATGVVDLQTEADGTVRSVATRVRGDDGTRSFGFAEALAQSVGETPSSASRAFVAPPASLADIPRLSARAVASCMGTAVGRDALKRLLSGHLVIIGAGLDGEDEHPGPDRFLSRAETSDARLSCSSPPAAVRPSGRVPGALLQAAALQDLLGRRIVLAPTWARIMADAVALAGAALLAFAIGRTARLPERRGWLLGTTLASAASLVVAFGLLTTLAVAIAAAGLMVGTWLPLGTPMAVACAGCAVAVLAAALRRDVALADLRVAFGHFLPSPVVEAALGRDRDILKGAEREVSVLVADLNGFTAFCSTRRDRPEEVVEAINARFSAAQAAIDRHGGTVDKFVGDAVIAIWNGIERQDGHAMQAAAAAVDIAHGGPEREDGALQFKCAVATGLAFVGRYGAAGKGSFSAIGEPMNLAARLVTLCRPGSLDVVVAEPTVRAIAASGAAPHGFTLRPVGSADLKGFASAMPYHVADLSRTPARR